MTTWDDLNARARGLSTHLLDRSALLGLSRAPDLAALADELARCGVPLDPSLAASPAALELAARRVAARRLRTLARWAGRREELLAVLFEDEDRRSISALLRGAVQRAPAEQRLSGLLPTPALPERALQELAGQPGPAQVAALISAWHHPLAAALGTSTRSAEPDLLRIEQALSMAFAQRALANARRAGRRGSLYRHVQRVIDLENLWTALALTGEKQVPVRDYWVPGGDAVPLSRMEAAIATEDLVAAGRVLARGFTGSALQAVLGEIDRSAENLEGRALAAWIEDLRHGARREPLSAIPLLLYALRLRAEVLDIRWLIWGAALHAPPAALAAGLVTSR
jgi:vacuolar-type H+-ATPase subunit C/Vma6